MTGTVFILYSNMAPFSKILDFLVPNGSPKGYYLFGWEVSEAGAGRG